MYRNAIIKLLKFNNNIFNLKIINDISSSIYIFQLIPQKKKFD